MLNSCPCNAKGISAKFTTQIPGMPAILFVLVFFSRLGVPLIATVLAFGLQRLLRIVYVPMRHAGLTCCKIVNVFVHISRAGARNHRDRHLARVGIDQSRTVHPNMGYQSLYFQPCFCILCHDSEKNTIHNPQISDILVHRLHAIILDENEGQGSSLLHRREEQEEISGRAGYASLRKRERVKDM